MKSVNRQIINEIEQKAQKENISKLDAANMLLKEFDDNNLIVSSQHVKEYITHYK